MKSSDVSLILASSSVYRSQLLSRLGVSFSTMSPDIDESMLAQESVAEMVLRLGKAKADKVQQSYPDAWVIASDQSAVCDGLLLNKPLQFEAALAQLKQQQGKMVTFYTSLVLSLPDGRLWTHVDETKVFFRCLQDQQLIAYLHSEQPYHCAGAFKSEGLGVVLFERILTEDPSALIGLPIIRLANWLTDLDVLLS